MHKKYNIKRLSSFPPSTFHLNFLSFYRRKNGPRLLPFRRVLQDHFVLSGSLLLNLLQEGHSIQLRQQKRTHRPACRFCFERMLSNSSCRSPSDTLLGKCILRVLVQTFVPEKGKLCLRMVGTLLFEAETNSPDLTLFSTPDERDKKDLYSGRVKGVKSLFGSWVPNAPYKND